MQTETQEEKELRLQRREYLKQLENKLSNKKKPKKDEEKDEVVSIDESSNNDRLFSEDEE